MSRQLPRAVTSLAGGDAQAPGRWTGRRLRVTAAAGLLGLLLALLPAWAGDVHAVPPGEPASDAKELERLLATQWRRTGLPGMAVAVTHGAEVRYLGGFGSDGRGRPVDADSQFMIASLSKSFTAVAVLQLVERGDVVLDAPVHSYLPEFATDDPETSRRITVRQLLNQTSGMADAGFRGGLTSDASNLQDRLRDLRSASLVSAPGQEFHYFDPNYQVLARLVEVVSGHPFGDQLRREVLAPLGMTGTITADRADEARQSAPRLAAGHIVVFGAPVRRPELDGLLTGSSGVVSSARDLARWLAFQTTAGSSSTPAIVDPRYVALTHTPPAGVHTAYGQGWQVVTPATGPRRIEHTGVLSTYYADQVLLPDSGYAFALLYNGNAALADVAGVKVALAAYLDGGRPRGVRGWWWEAVLLGSLTLAVAAAGGISAVRQRRRQPPARTARRSVLAVAIWALVPLAVFSVLPWLLLTVTDRWFTHWQLTLAMPDVIIFLVVTGGSGAIAAGARLLARKGTSPPRGRRPGTRTPR